MNLDQETYQLIEQYLYGQMEPEERMVFETRLHQEEDLMTAFTFLKDLADFGQYQEDEAQMEKLKALGDQHFQTEPQIIKPKRFKYYFSAAAAVLLLVLAYFLMKSFQTKDLYQTYTQSLELSLTELGGTEDLLPKAESHFQVGEYQNTLELLGQYLAAKPHDMEILEAKGITLLKMNEFDQAVSTFSQIINSDALASYKDRANWYKALALYGKKDLSTCRNTLEIILKNKKSKYHKEAKELLINLELEVSRPQ